MVKHKKLLSWLTNLNAKNATVAWIIFLLLSSGGITLFKLAWSVVVVYGGFTIATFLQYKIFSNKIEKGIYKESDFMTLRERKKQNQELSQEKDSEESDNHKSPTVQDEG